MKITIGRRIGAGFTVIILIMLMLAVVAAQRVGHVDDELTAINDANSVKQRYAINFRGSVHDRAIALRDVVLAESPTEVDTEVSRIEKLAAAYAESATKMDGIYATPGMVDEQERAALKAIQDVEAKTTPLVTQVVDLKRAGDQDQAHRVLVQEAKPLFVDWLASINKLIDMEEAKNQQASASAREVTSSFLRLMLIGSGTAALIAALTAWKTTTNLTRRIDKAAAALAAAARGDLTQRPTLGANDELAQMGASLNTALDSIGNALKAAQDTGTGLQQTSKHLHELAARIAVGAADSATQTEVVSRAAGEVSRNVQAVSAGSTEMGSAITEIAHSTNEAAAVAAQAVTSMLDTTATVARLGDSSREIGEVVKVITSIAEQTNLLALNATIEAARAGELGKGFAVVASEVKDLAQETARATESISARVQAIQADTAGAAEAIASITSVIEQINQYQTTIAAAVEEQSATTTEMSRGIAEAAEGSAEIANNIDVVAEVTRSTQGSVAEAEAAAGELSRAADELHENVGRFRF